MKASVMAALALLVAARACPGQTNFYPLLVCRNRVYTNATIESVTPATVIVSWGDSGEQIAITNLPETLQKQYGNDPKKAAVYLHWTRPAPTAGRILTMIRATAPMSRDRNSNGPTAGICTSWNRSCRRGQPSSPGPAHLFCRAESDNGNFNQ